MTMIPNMARKPIDATHGADDQRSCALPSRVTQTEVGPDRPTEGSMRESEGVTPLGHVVEGDLASIIVQENPHPLERGPQGEGTSTRKTALQPNTRTRTQDSGGASALMLRTRR